MALIAGETKEKSFKTDRQIETKFAKQIKAILGNCFISQSDYMDLNEGTDFMIVTMKNFKCGVRLRRFKFFTDFNDQFTIRWKRPSGVPTEIDKIREGKVNYILYGFICPSEKRIIQWFLGDLAIFNNVKIPPLRIFQNVPHDSDLAVFRISDFPKEFIKSFWIDKHYMSYALKDGLRNIGGVTNGA